VFSAITVDVEHFLSLEREEDHSGRAPDDEGNEPDGYYFVFGRVVPYKRVDLAVAACAQLGRRVRVAGDGRALESVRAQAPGAGAEFLGKVSPALRDRLLSGARALLFPGEEDFGIVPVEAQAAGVPVIAYGVGGAAETVVDGRTGVLFTEQSASALAEAIERFEGMALDGEWARENARRFGRERFRAEMADVIARAAAVKGD
jgi:glycosyltransferase involved in cell wall biosynthesis